MWKLYDDLIAGIPAGIPIADYHVGCGWSEVTAGGNTGVALTVRGRAHVRLNRAPVIGADLKAVASLVKSWYFLEASLGMAAINCWYNTPEKVNALNGFEGTDNPRSKDAFLSRTELIRNRCVTVVGHFPNLEEQFGPICELSVLERNPEEGDYPDSACEYLLPDQDWVFITGMAFINKTLPRLLSLTRPDANIVLVGPSVPLAPVLRHYGVTDLDGFCVTDAQKADEIIRQGENRGIFASGKMVSISLHPL